MTILNKVSNKTLMPGITPIPDVPDAPTIGTATISGTTASVPFTAAVTGGTVTTFTATSTPGSITGTSATPPVSVSGLTPGTAYTFKVKGTNSTATGPESSASNSITATLPVANPKLWLDASDASTITSSGGFVSQWTDKSSNAYTFTQPTSTKQPATGTRTINSKNVIKFDGVNDNLVSTSAASVWNLFHDATAATVFMVLSLDANQDQPLLTTSNDTTNIGMWFYTRTTGTSFGSAILNGTSNKFVALEYSNTATYTASTPLVIATVWDAANATAANRLKFYKNSGAEDGTFQQTDVTYTSSNAAYPLWIGAWPLSNAFNGVIGEIVIYPGVLSDANRNSVSDYLKTKWGVA